MIKENVWGTDDLQDIKVNLLRGEKEETLKTLLEMVPVHSYQHQEKEVFRYKCNMICTRSMRGKP